MHEIVIVVIHLETIFNHVRKLYPWCNSLSFTTILWSVIFVLKFMPNEPTEKCKHHMIGPKEHHHSKEMVMGDGKEILSLYA